MALLRLALALRLPRTAAVPRREIPMLRGSNKVVLVRRLRRERRNKTSINNFHKVLRRLVLRLDRLQTKWAGLSSRGSAIKEELQ